MKQAYYYLDDMYIYIRSTPTVKGNRLLPFRSLSSYKPCLGFNLDYPL